MWYFAEIAPRGMLGLIVFSYLKANFKKLTNLFTYSTFIEQIVYGMPI